MESITPECQKNGDIVKRVAGWIFANLYHDYFGESSIVLVGEGKNENDLGLLITTEWLEANQITQFITSKFKIRQAMTDTQNCSCPYCIEMNNRLQNIWSYKAQGKLPGSPALAIHSRLVSRRRDDKSKFSVHINDKDDLIVSKIKPFFLWFFNDSNFWLWPNYPAELIP